METTVMDIHDMNKLMLSLELIKKCHNKGLFMQIKRI